MMTKLYVYSSYKASSTCRCSKKALLMVEQSFQLDLRLKLENVARQRTGVSLCPMVM
jgi:hypothetical protein